jgi:hypothetical protein
MTCFQPVPEIPLLDSQILTSLDVENRISFHLREATGNREQGIGNRQGETGKGKEMALA